MNFTTRPPSACTTSLTVPPNSTSRSDNSVGVSTCVSAVKPVRSANPTPHVTLCDVSRMHAFEMCSGRHQVMAEDGVEHGSHAGHELRDRAIGLRRGELVVGVVELDRRQSLADDRRDGFGLAAPGRTERPAADPVRGRRPPTALSAAQVPKESTSAWLSASSSGSATVSPRAAQAPAISASGTPSCLGRRPQRVCRAARALQHVACQPEQAALLLGFDHLLGGESEAGQVFDQGGRSRALAMPAACSASKSTTSESASVAPRLGCFGVSETERAKSCTAPSRNAIASSARVSPSSPAG